MRSWAGLGAYVGGLGSLLGSMLAVLGRFWCLCGRSGAEKCEEHCYLENVFISRMGVRTCAYFSSGSAICCLEGRSRALSWRSWAALGPYVGGLGPLLGPVLAVLGRSCGVSSRSWSLCWQSWAALGIYVGGLGPLLAVLGGLGPKSGQNPSGNQGPKGHASEAPRRDPPKPAFLPTDFFYMYVS